MKLQIIYHLSNYSLKIQTCQSSLCEHLCAVDKTCTDWCVASQTNLYSHSLTKCFFAIPCYLASLEGITAIASSGRTYPTRIRIPFRLVLIESCMMCSHKEAGRARGQPMSLSWVPQRCQTCTNRAGLLCSMLTYNPMSTCSSASLSATSRLYCNLEQGRGERGCGPDRQREINRESRSK